MSAIISLRRLKQKGTERVIGSALVVLVLSGCGPRLEYEIHMRVTEEGFSRRVTVTSSDQAEPEQQDHNDKKVILPDNVRDRFTKIYGPGEPVDEAIRFEKDFTGRTPDDIGGVGALQRLPSDLGVAFVYHERIQGKYPTHPDQAERREAIDEFLRYILGWLESELEGKPGAEAISRLVDHQLRADLYDLQLLLESLSYSAPLREERVGDTELLFMHFLLERDYLTLEDAAHVATGGRTCHGDFTEWWLDRLHDYLQRQLGDATDDETLAIFRDRDQLASSLRGHLRSLPEYEQYREAQAEPDDEDPPEPLNFLSESLAPLFPLLFSFGPDQVTLLLQLDREPLQTNGEWDEETGVVRWQWDVQQPAGDEDPPPQLPRIAMASWVEPNASAQSDRFGETLLNGGMLMNYCVWHATLDAAQVERWASVASQLPSRSHRERIELLSEFSQGWDDEDDFPAWLGHLVTSLP